MSDYYHLDLSEGFIRELRETLEDMVEPVRVDVFVGERCDTCKDTLKLLTVFHKASPSFNGGRKLRLRVLDARRSEDRGEFIRQRVQRVPTVSLLDGHARWTGIPAGEEVRALVESIMRISEGESGLEGSTKRAIGNIRKPVYIETIVTPSCPYCPYAVLLAHMFAYESFKQGIRAIVSNAIEAYENTDIAEKYGIMSVPAVAVNGRVAFMGVPYEEDFIEYIEALVKGEPRRRGFKTSGDINPM